MNFKSDAENKFKDCDRETLVQYCDMWGLEHKPNHGAAHLRKLLLEGLNQYHETVNLAPGEKAIETNPMPEHKRLTPEEIVGLNLRSQGHWQGKRRRITLHRAMEYESTVFPHFFAWEGLHCYVPFGNPVDIPYAVYNILMEANTGKKLVRKRKVDEEGRIFYEETWVPVQRFMFTDHGVTPETEHLPEDIQDQMRMLWEATNGFDGYSASQFRQICRMLKIRVREDWKSPDMKGAVKRLLGLGVESELASPAARMAKA